MLAPRGAVVFAGDGAAAVVERAGGGGAAGRALEGTLVAVALAFGTAAVAVVAGAMDDEAVGALATAVVTSEGAVDGSVVGAVDTLAELAAAAAAATELAGLELALPSASSFVRNNTAPPIKTSVSRIAPPAAASAAQGVRAGTWTDGAGRSSTVA